MIRSELVEKLSDHMDITQVEADRIVRAFCEVIITGVKIHGKVTLRNFGSFTSRTMKGYVGKKPWANGRITIPARRYPWFRASKNLNALVNNGGVHHE